MRVLSILGVLALTLFAPACLAEGVSWETDYKKGLEAAAKANKPMFIEFTASW